MLGDLTELYERLGRADAVLTPHLTAPIEDARGPLRAGDPALRGLQPGVPRHLASTPRTLPFLDWWARRLYRECLHEVERGLFVDQRWMDFAPAFLPGAEILRDPGYNVAYWNLAHRDELDGDAATAGAARRRGRCASSTSAATTSGGRS